MDMNDRPATPATGAGAASPEPAPRVAEQLSALLDDELPPGELELLLARFGGAAADDPARQRLARYGLVQATLRRSAVPQALGVADRVARALGSYGVEAPAAPRVSQLRWLAPGLAAVVAIALAVTIALAPVTGSGPGAYGTASAPAVAGVQAPRPRVATRAVLPPDQLTSYLVYHGEYSGSLSAALVDAHVIGHHPAAARP